jgi:predicted ArsR family transcriptional regulator
MSADNTPAADIARLLRDGPMTLKALSFALKQPPMKTWAMLDAMRGRGEVICERRNHNNGRPAIQWRMASLAVDAAP